MKKGIISHHVFARGDGTTGAMALVKPEDKLVPERSWAEIKLITPPPFRWLHVSQEYYKQSVTSEAGVKHEFFLPYFLDSTGKHARGRTFKHIVVNPATAADLSVPHAEVTL